MIRKITLCSIFTVLCMVCSFLETKFIFFPFAPGIKIGLANCIVLIFFAYGFFKEGLLINICRILLSSFLFSGIFSLAFSLPSAIFSMGLMFLIRKVNILSVAGKSVLCATFHNLTQALMYTIIYGAAGIISYLPLLTISGAIAGLLTGITALIFKERFTKILNNN